MRIATKFHNEHRRNKGKCESLTLHPTLPLIRLLAIQESEVLVFVLERSETGDETDQAQSSKDPRLELLLLLEPNGRPVGHEVEANNRTKYRQGNMVVRAWNESGSSGAVVH